MKRLRDPKTGCPWDIQQNYMSITPSTLEEAYEVVDAIERGDFDHLREELGDLLFQVVFYSEMASEENRWAFDDVVHTLTDKLIRRHPHVFPDGRLNSERSCDRRITDEDIKGNWESIKQAERESKGKKRLLDDIPQALPALRRAEKIQKRAAKVGFDWSSTDKVLDKLNEEVGELNDAMKLSSQLNQSVGHQSVEEELGDVLFTCVNLARHLKLDAEQLLRTSNRKFEKRFGYIEDRIIDSGKEVNQASLAEMDELWNQAKNTNK